MICDSARPNQHLPIDVINPNVSRPTQALGRSGFINYFGSQRFGSYGSPTSSIGGRDSLYGVCL